MNLIKKTMYIKHSIHIHIINQFKPFKDQLSVTLTFHKPKKVNAQTFMLKQTYTLAR